MKRARSDSAASAVKAMVSASLPDLQPPAHVTLSDSALRFWGGITRARAREEWREVDLVVAAQLAECQALIEQESALLRSEGTLMDNGRGTSVENPRNRVIQNLAQREMALMRTLLMGGKAAADPRSFKGARQVEAAARKVRQELEADDLLA
jgi:hypothetical protein